MNVVDAIRARRTHKAYGPHPVDRETLDTLLDLARYAPNHHLTNPWRFRVLGPAALARLKAAAGPDQAAKLDRAPTLVAVSALRTPGDPVADEEDLLATACAAYIVLLAAHEHGLAGYWRTPEVLRRAAGRDALGIGDDERFVALLYLGTGRQDPPAPQRAPARDVTTYLD